MRIQYGHILTLVALCVAIQGSSIEDALGGMSNGWDPSELLTELNTFDSYPTDSRFGNNYDYDYNPSQLDEVPSQSDEVPSQPDESEVDMSADVPKTSGLSQSGESQDNQGFRANTMLPAYCDPPNPCPIGYTTADGCIEDFENSSEFSRGYQSNQKCICDTEHMFDCPDENAHRGADDIAAVNILADVPGLMADDNNPYLGGQKLPVAAKKGNF